MLENRFKHHAWFKDKKMTVKEFLDYVLDGGDFGIKTKYKSDSLELFSAGSYDYYLTDNRYSYKLNVYEAEYLSAHSEFFRERLEGFRNAG